MSTRVRTITVPIFNESQVNKHYDENDMPTAEITPTVDVLKINISSSIESAMNTFGEEDTIIFMCVMQKTTDNRKLGICAFPFNHDDTDELVVDITGIEVKPKFTIVGRDIIKVV
jgi:hypothetical protein